MEEGALIRKAVEAAIVASAVTEDLCEDKSKALSTSEVGDWIVNYLSK
jgi:3-isopropylmalate dehydrogenase